MTPEEKMGAAVERVKLAQHYLSLAIFEIVGLEGGSGQKPTGRRLEVWVPICATVFFAALLWWGVKVARAQHSEACITVMRTAVTHEDTLRVNIACYLDGEDALRAVPLDPAVHPAPTADSLWDRDGG
jgi:hypothetical protein